MARARDAGHGTPVPQPPTLVASGSRGRRGAAGRYLSSRLQPAQTWCRRSGRRRPPPRLGDDRMRILMALVILASNVLMAAPAEAIFGGLGMQVKHGPQQDPSLSLPLQIAISLTLLTLLPAIVACITPFLPITLVLHFLRQALGTPPPPSTHL